MVKGMDALADGLRQAMRLAPASVAVITSSHGGVFNGMTVTSVCSVSMEPPSLLVCIHRDAATHDLIANSKGFCASFLYRDQQHVAEAFAASGTGEEKLNRCTATSREIGGQKGIDGSLSLLSCSVSQAIESGTHTVFIGEIGDFVVAESGTPLLYGMQGFGGFDEQGSSGG